MSTGISPKCFSCVHLAGITPGVGWTCAAFDGAIPKNILVNQHDHVEPYEGDHGIRFRAKLPLRAAGIVFVTDAGETLLLRRSAADRDTPGMWAFPGGRIEPGETAQEAALREAREELGETFPEVQLVPWTRRVRSGVDFTTFLANVPERFTPRLNGEHNAHRWVDRKELLRGDAAKRDKASVGYVSESAETGERCAGCTMFQPPSSCTAVDGTISPHGWCRLFKALRADDSGLQELAREEERKAEPEPQKDDFDPSGKHLGKMVRGGINKAEKVQEKRDKEQIAAQEEAQKSEHAASKKEAEREESSKEEDVRRERESKIFDAKLDLIMQKLGNAEERADAQPNTNEFAKLVNNAASKIDAMKADAAIALVRQLASPRLPKPVTPMPNRDS